MARPRDDRELLERYMVRMLGKPLEAAKRGELMDVYRTIALQMGTEVSAPRMWRSRNVIPHHARRLIGAAMEADLPVTALEAISFEKIDFPPAVTEVAREIQHVYELTKGRGEVWRSLLAAITMAKTWARRGAPYGQRHLRPISR